MSKKSSRAVSYGISVVTFSLVAIVMIGFFPGAGVADLKPQDKDPGKKCGAPLFNWRCGDGLCNEKKLNEGNWEKCIKGACGKAIPGTAKVAGACFDAENAACKMYCVNELKQDTKSTKKSPITGQCCAKVVTSGGHDTLNGEKVPASPKSETPPPKSGDPKAPSGKDTGKTPPGGGDPSKSSPSGQSPPGGGAGGGGDQGLMKSIMDLLKPQQQSGGSSQPKQEQLQPCIPGSIIPRPECPPIKHPLLPPLPPLPVATPTPTTTPKKATFTIVVGKIKNIFTGDNENSNTDTSSTKVTVTPLKTPGVTGFSAPPSVNQLEDPVFLKQLIGALTIVRDSVKSWFGR